MNTEGLSSLPKSLYSFCPTNFPVCASTFEGMLEDPKLKTAFLREIREIRDSDNAHRDSDNTQTYEEMFSNSQPGLPWDAKCGTAVVCSRMSIW